MEAPQRIAPPYHLKGILMDGTFADHQAAVHLRNDSAKLDASAAATAEGYKNVHDACPRLVSFDERSIKFTTF